MDQQISEEHRGVNMEEHGGVSIKGEDHDPMEDDDHALEITFEDDGMNTLIHDTFVANIRGVSESGGVNQ